LDWDDVDQVDLIGLEIGYGLIPLVNPDTGGQLMARVKGVRVLPVKRAGYIAQMYEGYAPKRPVGRPRKVRASPEWNLPNPYLRKVRKNKGAKRGPRGLALLARTIGKLA
jgi:hypothetical protein